MACMKVSHWLTPFSLDTTHIFLNKIKNIHQKAIKLFKLSLQCIRRNTKQTELKYLSLKLRYEGVKLTTHGDHFWCRLVNNEPHIRSLKK